MLNSAMETLIFQELRATNDYLKCNYQLYFWRTKNGLEVDFILYGPKGLIAIEVKRSARVHPKTLRCLKEIILRQNASFFMEVQRRFT